MDGLLRITQILKPFSGYGHIDQAVLDKAADRGTRVHCACNAIIQHLSYPEEDDTKGYIESFKKWELENKHITLPKRFEDKELGITGECDGIWVDKDKKFILYDIKTSYKEGKTWPLQLGAYVYLAQKAGFQIDKAIVLHLDKNGKKPKVIEYDYVQGWDKFMKCLEIYKLFFINEKYFEAEDFL